MESIDVTEVVSIMTDDKNENINIIKNYLCEDLNETFINNYTLLHLFCLDNVVLEEPKRLLALQSLLDYGLSPNQEDIVGQNFIQSAMFSGTTEQFILQLIDEAIKYGLNVNHQDCSGNTIMHSAIFSDNYDIEELINIYKLLCNNKFNHNKINNDGMDIIKAIFYKGTYSHEEIELFKKIVDETNNSEKSFDEDNTDISELEEYGQILNNKVYRNQPAVGRDEEFMNLMISLAKEKENAVLVGESGVGKSAICDQLAFQIQKKNVPYFLKGRIILETTPSFLVSGCEYVGQFEQKMHKFLSLCDKYGIIVVINEIHNIFGTGSYKNNDTDMSEILKGYLEKSQFKMIGTTTNKEYQKYFANTALKRRFGKIDIKEPNDEVLKIILYEVIKNYIDNNNLNEINIKKIVEIIVELTKKKHRTYNDIENNPALAISIIDTAFAVRKVYDDENIEVKHFIYAIKNNYRLYESAKEKTINELEQIKDISVKHKQLNKVISIKQNIRF